jgi:hypothetical protein
MLVGVPAFLVTAPLHAQIGDPVRLASLDRLSTGPRKG